MDCEETAEALTETTVALNKVLGLVNAVVECIKTIALHTAEHEPLPEQPLVWINNMTIELGKQAKALNASVQRLRPLVDPEATREFAAENADAAREIREAAAAEAKAH